MRKYHNQKTIYKGIRFDSKKEAERYAELLMLEKEHIIYNLRRQVKYTLIPSQYAPSTALITKGKYRGTYKRGRLLEREVAYIADFEYMKDGALIVEDVKGHRTPEYIIKRKMMLWKYGIIIKET